MRGPEGLGGPRPRRRALVLGCALLISVALAGFPRSVRGQEGSAAETEATTGQAIRPESPSAETAGPGEFSGFVYTADDADSIAQAAQVTLVYRSKAGEMVRSATTTADDGRFCFSGLSTDPERDYVLRVDFRGKVSVGSPVRFPAGESVLQFDVLIGDGTPPEGSPDGSGRSAPEGPGGSMGIKGGGEEALPPGHPPVPGMTPVVGRPVPQNVAHTVLLTSAVAALFGLPIGLLSRKDRSRERRAARNG